VVSEQAGRAADVINENLDRLGAIDAPEPIAAGIDTAVTAGKSGAQSLRGADVTRLREALKQPFGDASDGLAQIGIRCLIG